MKKYAIVFDSDVNDDEIYAEFNTLAKAIKAVRRRGFNGNRFSILEIKTVKKGKISFTMKGFKNV